MRAEPVFIVGYGLVAALLWGGPVCGQISRAAKAKPVVRAKVTQKIVLPDMKMTSVYEQGTFRRGGMMRVEGKIRAPALTGDERSVIKIKMVSDNKVLRQLVEIEGLLQLFTYDLEKVRREFGDAAVGRDLDPCALGESLGVLIKGDKPERKERLKGEKVSVYAIPIVGAFVSAPMPGLASSLPEPKRMVVWMAEDGLPRKVEAYDVKGQCFLVTTFENVEMLDDVPEAFFSVKVPKDALVIDMTPVLLEAFRSQKGAKKKAK